MTSFFNIKKTEKQCRANAKKYLKYLKGKKNKRM